MKIRCKKIIKYSMFALIFLLISGIILANIDYSRTKKGKAPIFAVSVGINKQYDTKKYYGLGYIVLKCPTSNEEIKYPNKYELYFLDNRSDCFSEFNSIIK